MSKKAKSKKAVAVMTAQDIEKAKTTSSTIAQTVRGDMQTAENGMFYALRAGVGLLRIKELFQHGDWANELLDMFPEKAPRSLQKYMQVAGNFLEAKNVKALDVWNGMSAISSDRLLAAPGADAKPEKGKEGALVRDVREFLTEFGSIRKAIKGEAEVEQGRPLTKSERSDTARAFWGKICNMVQDGLNNSDYALLTDEEVDSLASALRMGSDTLRKNLAARGAKI